MERRTVDGLWGLHINATIDKLIELAKDGPVQCEFNSVVIYVDQDSDPQLIYRDWDRAISGYIKGPVGPHPTPVLSDAELAHDALVECQNQKRAALRAAEYEERMAREKAEYNAALSTTLPMQRDEVKWQEGIDAQKGDGYGLAVYSFAEAWARLMQARMSEGAKLEDVAEECCSLADKAYGITGFMYGCAVSTLAHCWVHGEDLRRWHNLTTQIGREGEKANDSGGVLNPAVLSIG